jgi:hypothetical protein
VTCHITALRFTAFSFITYAMQGVWSYVLFLSPYCDPNRRLSCYLTISVHGGKDRIQCGSSLSLQHGVQDLFLVFTFRLVRKMKYKCILPRGLLIPLCLGIAFIVLNIPGVLLIGLKYLINASGA